MKKPKRRVIPGCAATVAWDLVPVFSMAGGWKPIAKLRRTEIVFVVAQEMGRDADETIVLFRDSIGLVAADSLVWT